MTLTRQHFQLIADVVKDSIGYSTPDSRNVLAREFANKLASTNPNFDRARFLVACGVEV
jgi:hypothetical protein